MSSPSKTEKLRAIVDVLKQPFGSKRTPEQQLQACIQAIQEYMEDDDTNPTPAMLPAMIRKLGEKMRHWRRAWAEIEVDRRKLDAFQLRIGNLVKTINTLPESSQKQRLLDLVTAPLPLEDVG